MSKERKTKGIIMGQLIIDALKAKYVAQRLENIANLQAYLSTSVGVAEHSGIVAECDKLITNISTAEGKLQSLIVLVEQVTTKE
tara:strand:- start:1018 stop:1269 length:252 start_codon:yes stop_codon:yes gene_type:complete